MQMAFRQNFEVPPASKSRTSLVESVVGSDIVNQAATEPSTVFNAPSVQSPVTLYSEDVRRASRPADDSGRIEWEMILAQQPSTDETETDVSLKTPPAIFKQHATTYPGPGLTLPPARKSPTRPRSLHDSVILNGATQVLRQSQQVVPIAPVAAGPAYAIPRPLSESTQGARTVSTAPVTNRVFGQRPAPIRTSATPSGTVGEVTARQGDGPTATTTPKLDPPTRLIAVAVDETDPLSPYFAPSPSIRSSRPSSASSLGSLTTSSHRPLSTLSTTNRTFGPANTPSNSQSGHSTPGNHHGRRKSDNRSIRSIPPPPGPPPISALPPPPTEEQKQQRQVQTPKTPKREKRASSPPPFSRGLPANPRKGPPTPPKDRVPSGARGTKETLTTPAPAAQAKGAPRIMSADFSADEHGVQPRMGSGSLGSFRF